METTISPSQANAAAPPRPLFLITALPAILRLQRCQRWMPSPRYPFSSAACCRPKFGLIDDRLNRRFGRCGLSVVLARFRPAALPFALAFPFGAPLPFGSTLPIEQALPVSSALPPEPALDPLSFSARTAVRCFRRFTYCSSMCATGKGPGSLRYPVRFGSRMISDGRASDWSSLLGMSVTPSRYGSAP